VSLEYDRSVVTTAQLVRRQGGIYLTSAFA